MTIKIKLLDRIAIKEPGKPWVSDWDIFAKKLNLTATYEQVTWYVPNMEEALIDWQKSNTQVSRYWRGRNLHATVTTVTTTKWLTNFLKNE